MALTPEQARTIAAEAIRSAAADVSEWQIRWALNDADLDLSDDNIDTVYAAIDDATITATATWPAQAQQNGAPAAPPAKAPTTHKGSDHQ